MKTLVRHLICVIAALTGASEAAYAATGCRLFPAGDVRLGESGPFAAAERVNRRYLLDELEPARFLAEFRKVAGLPEKAAKYGGWESRQMAGHSAGRYLSALSRLYAQTRWHEAKKRVDYMVEELWECQLKNGGGYVMTVPREAVWDKVKSGDFTTGEFDVCRWWRPLYTLEKVMSGLRDAYRYAGSSRALDVEKGLADWFIGVAGGLDENKREKLLVSEWGSLNGVFADLAVDTKDRRYLDAARKLFREKRFFEPLARGEDRLDGASARAAAEKMAGFAAVCATDGDKDALKAAHTFWDAVERRRYPTGAFGDSERFYPVGDSARHLGKESGETCAACAMMRFAAGMFAIEPDAKYMDYVERALVNCVLASPRRKEGEYTYYQSLMPVAEKAYSHGHHVWTCCVAAGMEAPERYVEAAYGYDSSSLWVNLFIDSSVTWRKKGVVVRQRTNFPEDGKVVLEISCRKPVRLTMKIRRPGWCPKLQVKLNGMAKESFAGADGYIAIDRMWNEGDKVEFELPMKTRVEKFADGKFATYMKGPVVLAGLTEPEFGKEDFAKSRWGDDPHRAPGGTGEPARAVESSAGPPRPPAGMKFMPLWKVYEEHYTVCFPVCDPGEYRRREDERKLADRALAARKASVVDQVVIGWWPDEEAHRWNGAHDTVGENRGRKFRHAPGESGRFMYEMSVDPRAKQYVEATFWGDDNGRTFELCVDWKVIATITLERKHPGKFFTERFAIPKELTAGKERVMVCFRGKKGTTWTGAVFSLAIVK